MLGFFVEKVERGDEITLVLSGGLDLANADGVARTAESIQPTGSLILDLSGLEFVDSSGLRFFMNLDRRARREGWTLFIMDPRDQVIRLVQLCGFDKRLHIVHNNG